MTSYLNFKCILGRGVKGAISVVNLYLWLLGTFCGGQENLFSTDL